MAASRCWLAGLLCSMLGLCASAAVGDDVDPLWMLLHEPAVVEELQLNSEQQSKYRTLFDGLDSKFFPLRNQTPEVGRLGVAKLLEAARQQLNSVLTPKQFERLRQIQYWRLGMNSVLEDDVAAKLKITNSQRRRIGVLLAEAQQALAAIEQQAGDGQPRERLEKKYADEQASGQKKVLAVLKPEQQAAFKELLGEPFDAKRLGRPAFKAPELVDTRQWINSRPVRLADQRGKVVVIHIYACDCINCVHNYPWYREWQERFGDKNFLMVGIQSPETDAERNFNHVRQKAAEAKLTFPILFDVHNENWNAWGNATWPAVYVIDQRGYLRSYWTGELKWQGKDGEKFLRERIEELLKE